MSDLKQIPMPIESAIMERLQGFMDKGEYSEGEKKVKDQLDRIFAQVGSLHSSIAIMQGRIEEAVGTITKKAGQIELLMEVVTQPQPEEEPQDASGPG